MPDHKEPRELGFLRLKQIVGPSGLIPVSRSTWYNWVAAGVAPRSIKIGPQITVWSAEEIMAFAQRLKAEGGKK